MYIKKCNTFKIIRNSAIILLVLSAAFCGKPGEDGPRQIFLLNKIAAAEIVKTPDLKKFKLNKRCKAVIKNTNNDSGLQASPLIKKIKCLADTRNALFAPADSVYDFALKIKKGAKLKFGFAMDDMYANLRRVPIEFKVLVKKKEAKEFRLLFKERLFPGGPVSLGWHDKTLRLNGLDGDILLRLETKRHIENTLLGNHLFAYWSNLVVSQPADKNKHKKKPKLILISLDTLRADHLDIYDYHRKTSPEMVDREKDFVVFKNCWSQWCWTVESHHSIMTGLYEVEHKVPELYRTTPGHLVTLAEIMKTRGYITAAFTGAGHVGAHTGLCKGFDTYFDNEFRKKGGYELLGTWLRTKQWLEENKENDFFLFFHTYEIHAPYRTYIPLYDEMFQTFEGDNRYIFDVKREPLGNGLDRVDWYLNQKEGKKVTAEDRDVIEGYKDYYDGSIRYTNDYFLKEFISHLKSLGIYDDTIIVILSDHGEEFFEHGRFKHFDGLYEEYIHVPLMFKFPGSQYGGRVLERNVETIDVFPTLMEVLGIELKHDISGKSLLEWIKNESKKNSSRKRKGEKKYVFSQSGAKFAVKKDNMKLLLRGRVDRQLKGKIPRMEIYDLDKDPGEQKPLKIDDPSDGHDLYDALYNRIIRKERGIHIVFPGQLKGKIIEGKIDIPAGAAEIKNFFEIGITRGDMTRFTNQRKQIRFKWKMSGWKKSLILTSRTNKLKIKLGLKIDGKDYKSFVIHRTLAREGEYIRLKRKQRLFRPAAAEKGPEVFVFGNGIVKKVKKKTYFPEVSKKNLEKLKALGYIGNN